MNMGNKVIDWEDVTQAVRDIEWATDVGVQVLAVTFLREGGVVLRWRQVGWEQLRSQVIAELRERDAERRMSGDYSGDPPIEPGYRSRVDGRLYRWGSEAGWSDLVSDGEQKCEPGSPQWLASMVSLQAALRSLLNDSTVELEREIAR